MTTATPSEELLLKAALLEGPGAGAAWRRWRACAGTAPLDEDSSRLLPLVYHALRRRGDPDAFMERMERLYRRTWYDNTRLFNAAAAVLRALHGAGIETMLLKGPALVLRYYRNAGLRPMDDFDVLVPTREGPRALETLKRLGWAPVFTSVGMPEGDALAVGHAYPFLNPAGQAIDLHWHVFYQRVDADADSEFWAAARPIQLSGVPTHMLSPEDQLLHVCVHAMERAWWGGERRPNLRWAADAVMMLRTEGAAFDWDRLFIRARQLRFVLPMREALEYLHDVIGAPIPAPVLARMRTVSVPMSERIAQRARTRPSRRWGPWLALAVRYLEYSSRVSPDAGLLRRLGGLPSFLRARWGAGPVWTLPLTALFRGLRRLAWMWQRLPGASDGGVLASRNEPTGRPPE